MIALMSTVFVASLLGSLHCAGMCGGIVALCVSIEGQDHVKKSHLLLTYNLGRLATYATLGAISGSIGAAIDFSSSAAGVGRIAPMIAGGGMILIGLIALLRILGVSIGCSNLPKSLQGVLQRGYRAAFDRPPLIRAGLIGLMTGLLPCGWLYAFVITSAGTGHAALGALTMSVFWIGTLPIMVAMGVGMQKLAGPLRRHVPTMTALVLVLVGVYTVLGRVKAPAFANAGPSTSEATIEVISLDQLARDVDEIDSSEAACCDDEH